MRMKYALLAVTLALDGCATGAGTDSGSDETAELSARLAGATYGRVPGPPVSCVTLTDLRGNRALGRELILFEGTGGRQWVTRVRNCPGLEYGRTLGFNAPSGRLCRGDAAQVLDPRSNAVLGSCAMGDFLSYVPRQ
jgi:hypothetical protein